jgi:Zn-dependent alcohol dehydrogenase
LNHDVASASQDARDDPRQQQPLKPATLPDPEPGPGQLLMDVHACGVCRTDLHLRDAEIAATKLPIVLGHQIVRDDDGRPPRRRRAILPGASR